MLDLTQVIDSSEEEVNPAANRLSNPSNAINSPHSGILSDSPASAVETPKTSCRITNLSNAAGINEQSLLENSR